MWSIDIFDVSLGFRNKKCRGFGEEFVATGRSCVQEYAEGECKTSQGTYWFTVLFVIIFKVDENMSLIVFFYVLKKVMFQKAFSDLGHMHR